MVLAELSRRELVPAIWLPDPAVRADHERARYRLHLVRHRTMFKNRIHATLTAFGKPCPVSDLFGSSGRRLLSRLELPEPWTANIADALEHVDRLDAEIDECTAALRNLGDGHLYAKLLTSIPGVGSVLSYTIASEIGDIHRFASRRNCAGTPGCAHGYQSGSKDHRGPLAKTGPKYLRWALIEAAVHAAKHPAYREHYERTATRLGRQRGKKVARVDVARKLAGAIWHMCTPRPFTPARSHVDAVVA